MGTLHCLFNREQISKKIEAHQSFEFAGGGLQRLTCRRFLIFSAGAWLRGFGRREVERKSDQRNAL